MQLKIKCSTHNNAPVVPVDEQFVWHGDRRRIRDLVREGKAHEYFEELDDSYLFCSSGVEGEHEYKVVITTATKSFAGTLP